MKRLVVLILAVLFIVLTVGVLFFLRDKKDASEVPYGYKLLLTLDGSLSLYSQDGRLKVGKNSIYVVLKPEAELRSLYFYMPPMPGMGEMREDALLKKVRKGIYEGVVNLSMAGSWQVIADIEGKIIKRDLSIPFEGEKPKEKRSEGISLDYEKLQLIGVQVEEVKRQELVLGFNAVGYVSYDLSRTYEVSFPSDVWVLDTFGRFEGEVISKGKPIMKVLSPEVEIAREELRIAREIGKQELEKAVLEKLSYFRVGEVISSPHGGVILERRVSPGSFLKAGDVAYKIADFSKIWIIGEVPQEYGSHVSKGTRVLVKPVGSSEEYIGKVDYIFPEADRSARTVRVRISLPNKNLKINQLVDLYFEKPIGEVLAVPESAVVDTGRRQVVFVEVERGYYLPKIVKLGRRTEGYYEVLEGLKEGDRIVIKGTFLLDSEARLKGIYGEGIRAHEH